MDEQAVIMNDQEPSFRILLDTLHGCVAFKVSK